MNQNNGGWRQVDEVIKVYTDIKMNLFCFFLQIEFNATRESMNG
jgi:hypothetical protein